MRLNLLIVVFLVTMGDAASADFVPGRFYGSRFPMDGTAAKEGIWEFDPVTGTSRLFAETEAFGRDLTGLTFTPDGSLLLASLQTTSRIVAFDSNAVGSVYLDYDDGIRLPEGSNNIAYDQFGNFFVANSVPSEILRFPPDGGPGTLFGDVFGGGGSIAAAPDGSLYYASQTLPGLFHVLTFGAVVQIDELPGTVATAVNGDVYLINVDGIYRYPFGGAREFLAPDPQGTATGITTLQISPDQQSLIVYTLHGTFYSVDRYSAATTYLGQFSFDQQLFGGSGFAIAVPEPGPCIGLFVGGLLCVRSLRNLRYFIS